MKKQIADKLSKALRSGAYDQTQNHLAIEDVKTGATNFCCLGVLCELHAQEGLGVWEVTKNIQDDTELLGYEDSGIKNTSTLPYDVRKWANMKSTTGYITSSDYTKVKIPDSFTKAQRTVLKNRLSTSLVTLNDRAHCTFDQIADFIELNWELL